MDPETKAAFANLEKLVEDTSASLQREMEAGFDRVEAATRRNTGSIVGGAVAIAALNKWAKQRDKLDTKRGLRARMLKVERSLKRRAG